VQIVGRTAGAFGVFEATTSEAGEFVTPPVLPGAWRLVVTSPLGPLTLVEPKGSVVEIGPGMRLDLTASRTGAALVGSVRRSGQPVADATVRLDGANGMQWSLLTGDDGSFASEQIPLGPYRVTAQTGSLFGAVDVSLPSPNPVVIDVGEGASLGGKVRGDDGVLITVISRQDPGGARSQFTEGSAFEIHGLPPGPAVLFAAKGGRRALREVVLEAGRMTEVEIVLPGGSPFVVRVVERESRRPLADVSCHLGSVQALSLGVRVSNRAGEIRFDNVVAGHLELRCWAPQAREMTIDVDTATSSQVEVQFPGG